jgi:hypothetical protein
MHMTEAVLLWLDPGDRITQHAATALLAARIAIELPCRRRMRDEHVSVTRDETPGLLQLARVAVVGPAGQFGHPRCPVKQVAIDLDGLVDEASGMTKCRVAARLQFFHEEIVVATRAQHMAKLLPPEPLIERPGLPMVAMRANEEVAAVDEDIAFEPGQLVMLAMCVADDDELHALHAMAMT